MENNRYREEEKELEKETISEKDVDSKEQVLVEELEKELEETEEELKMILNLIKIKKKIKHLEDENAKLTEELNQAKDQLLRNRADLENFKRRTAEERIKERKYAMQDFLVR